MNEVAELRFNGEKIFMEKKLIKFPSNKNPFKEDAVI